MRLRCWRRRIARRRAPYRRGIIGMRDHTLDPMIAAGSIVQIDTQKRVISARRDWTHEFQRPIYSLTTRDTYVCGWCELTATLARLRPAMELPRRNRNRSCQLCGHSIDPVSFAASFSTNTRPIQLEREMRFTAPHITLPAWRSSPPRRGQGHDGS
jgi:hypothetical protein